MRIDFNDIKEITIPGMNNGTGVMTAKLFMDTDGKIIPCRIHPGGSIGEHKHETSDDINYIITGTGKALCDGVEESITKKHQKPRKKKLKISVMLTKISNCHNFQTHRILQSSVH